mgnify:CR=1 FL=1
MEECPICLENIRYPSCINPCNHMFCEPCITRWLISNETCPKCRVKCSKYTEDPSICIKEYYGSDKNLRRTVKLAIGF